MRVLKGQGLQLNEMVMIFAAVLIGAVVLLFIINASGGLSKIVEEFCGKHPEWCGGKKPVYDYQGEMAKASVDALSQAIACVSSPDNCRCIDNACTFYPESSGLTGMASAKNVSYQDWDTPLGGWENNPLEDNEESGKRRSFMVKVQCNEEDREVSCSVENFRLPQKFEGITDKPEEWIEGFGDPLFLVYWQKFPKGEDSWSSKSAWFSGAGTLMFATLCIGHIIGGIYTTIFKPGKVIKATGEMVKDGTSFMRRIYSKVRGALEGVEFRGTDDVINMIEKDGVWVMKETPKQKMLSILKNSISGLLSKETITKSISAFSKIAPKTAVYSGVASIIADRSHYIDARIGSELGKFIEEPNKIILQKALLYESNIEGTITIDPVKAPEKISDPTKENIVDVGRPVLLNKKMNFYPDSITGLYFASPCRADLAVKNEKVACESYSYNIKTGQTECEKPDSTGWIDIYKTSRKCGSFFTDINEDSENGISFLSNAANLIRNMKSVRVFQKDGNDFTIYDPLNEVTLHASENPRIVCCENTEKEYLWSFEKYCTGKGFEIVNDEAKCGKRPEGALFFTSIEGFDRDEGKTNDAILTATGSSCNMIYPSEIERQVFGNGEISSCRLSRKIYKTYYPYRKSLGNYITTNAYYLYSKDNSGNIDNFYGIVSWYYREGLWDTDDGTYTIIFLKDNNNDGYVDEAGQFYWIGGKKIQQYRFFNDDDYDGSVDEILSNRCFTDGIVVFPDKSNYGNEEHNFCYTSANPVTGIGTTIGMFATDVFLKRVPSPYTWIVGTAVDCGLLWLDIHYGNINWPG